jgi:hypothetical protein
LDVLFFWVYLEPLTLLPAAVLAEPLLATCLVPFLALPLPDCFLVDAFLLAAADFFFCCLAGFLFWVFLVVADDFLTEDTFLPYLRALRYFSLKVLVTLYLPPS